MKETGKKNLKESHKIKPEKKLEHKKKKQNKNNYN